MERQTRTPHERGLLALPPEAHPAALAHRARRLRAGALLVELLPPVPARAGAARAHRGEQRARAGPRARVALRACRVGARERAVC